jgi:hypothetical protein
MSYDITGYKLSKSGSTEEVLRILNGESDNEFEGEEFSPTELSTIDQLLLLKGFIKHQTENYLNYEFEKMQIEVFENELSIVIPYWEEAEENLNFAINIAREISGKTEILFFDPQVGNFFPEPTEAKTVFKSTVEKVKTIGNETKPWWKFW